MRKGLVFRLISGFALLMLGGCCSQFGSDDVPPPPSPPSATPSSDVPASPSGGSPQAFVPVQPQSGTMPQPPSAPAAMSQHVLDANLQARLDMYISKCINPFAQRALQSRRRYLSWCDAATGPTGNERHIYGLYNVSIDPNRCAEAVTKASGLPPEQPELDGMANAYLAALRTLLPLLDQADRYYERENYRDDNMAQGKALHPQLMAAWSGFETAYDRFSTRVDTLQDQVFDRELERCAALPQKNLRCHVTHVIVLSKRVLRAGTVEGGWEQIEAGPFIQQVTTLEQMVDTMEQYSKMHQAETDQARSFSWFLGDAQEYVTAAKERMRRVRDRTPYTARERENMERGFFAENIEGSPQKLVSTYNDLARSFGRLHWRM